MKVEDIFEKYNNDPEYDRSYVLAQLHEAERANSTARLSDMACQFYGALKRDDRAFISIISGRSSS